MLRFCANLSLLFTEVELSHRFALARQMGFSAVEIQFPYELPAATLRELLDEQQLQLVLFNVPADDLLQGGEGLAAVPSKRAQFEDALALALDYAQYLAPEVINVLPGRCHDPHQRTRYLDTLQHNLCMAEQQLAPLGIKTVFEAINTFDMPDFLVHSSQQMLDLLHLLQRPELYMQYDIYHMAMMGESPHDFLRQHAAKIGHIQFADVPGRGQPGSGLLDFAAIFHCIQHSAYTGWVGAEYRPSGHTSDSFAWLSTWDNS